MGTAALTHLGMQPSDAARGEGARDADAMRGSISALHHLLAKLGGSLDDSGILSLMAGGGSSFKARYREVVERLVSPDSDAQLLSALEELCDILAMSHDEQLAGFPVETVAPVLAQTLQTHQENTPVMLYAARVVTWLADILPPACSVMAKHNIVAALCGPLVVIGFMDVAEQCLTALEKLSAHVPEACLQQVWPPSLVL